MRNKVLKAKNLVISPFNLSRCFRGSLSDGNPIEMKEFPLYNGSVEIK